MSHDLHLGFRITIGGLVWVATGILATQVPQTPDVTAPQSTISDASAAVKDIVQTGRVSFLAALTPVARNELTALYEAGAYRPLWVDQSGQVTRDGRDALTLLTNAFEEGLNPEQYETSSLETAAAGLTGGSQAAAAGIATFDTRLSASMLRYLRDLHSGRVDPRTIGFRMTAPTDAHDFAAMLRTAVTGHSLPGLAAELVPQLVLYRNLRGKLAEYRRLAADPAVQRITLPTRVLHPGDSDAGLQQLQHLLAAVGDLPRDEAATAPTAYEGPIVESVKRFQSRHGLASDGTLGAQTQKALRVPLTGRVRQIELALERLRWLPHLDPVRFLAVNIPMFRMWAWDGVPPSGAPSFGMGVIVGKALNRQTPVFVESMEYLVFRPYWNVPPSILRGEIIPAIERDSEYLNRQNMEMVSGPGDDARIVPLTASSLEELKQGQLRVRQRPGPKNSLGLVKFIFPNDANVYLHSTPAPQLFSQSRRDFSHGCVRVEDPVGLAEWALKGQEGWNRESILVAMNGGKPRQVNLSRPIQVILFYITAVVTPEDGLLHFADDIYGHDTKLDRALLGVDRRKP